MRSRGEMLIRNISTVTVLFGLMLLCLLWGGLYNKVQSERQTEMDNALKETSNYARTFEEHTVRTIRGLDQILLLIKNQLEQNGSQTDIQRFIEEKQFWGQPFLRIGVSDETGDVYATSQVPFIQTNVREREHFRVHRDFDSRQLYIGKPVEGLSLGKLSIPLTRRVNKPDGSFGGIVVISADPNYFAEFYKQVNLGNNSSIVLMGRDGIIRARQSGNEVQSGLGYRRNVILEKLPEGAAGSLVSQSQIDGINRIYSYRALQDFPLVVIVGVSEAQVFRDFNQRVAGYLWAGAAATALIVLFVAALLAGIRRRKQAEEALKEANENLEHKVRERTREFQGANEELIAQNEEITAMNEEIGSLNQTLTGMNEELEEEVCLRQQSEEKLATRERQYRAITGLLIQPVEQTDELMKTILLDALQLIKAPEGVLGLFDAEQNVFVIRYATGPLEAFIGKEQSIEEGLRGQVYRSGETMWVEDYRTYPHRLAHTHQDRMTTLITVPLRMAGRIEGVISANWVDVPHGINQDELNVLGQYALFASIALKNAILHRDTVTLAFQDTLTGLPNRASLSARLESEMNRAKQGETGGAVLFIDLDDLKVVNDNYGHSFGDAVLIAAGCQIVETVGPDAFVARFGGDEFIVILSDEQSREKVEAMSEKLVRMLSQDYEVSGEHIHLSASLGAAFYPKDGDTAEEILKKADSAMHVAKNTDKDRWCFYEPHIGNEAFARMTLANSLRRALERGELFLHFQAQVSCDTRRIVGFEALLRWNSPEHGLVPPVKFIPIAEQSGLIHSIGQYVLIQACQFAHRLNEAGFPNLRVAVNISPRQLAAEDFVSVVKQCIVDAEIKANQLELEVTETVFIESVEECIEKLLVLKELGFHLALDDFGTGYSSLTYLRHLPVHTLKIDKAFIDPIPGDDSQDRFVRFIIEMAHSLNLQVVAEGVEKMSQVARLESFFCDIIQGYAFSRPVPAEDAIRLIMSKEYDK